ncbi:MAG: very short patch repair endonuclease [Deltaproteobacteria bacterium]|nr:very short patch repair endonuclease [Deltaproteobacteria bacterium]
MTDVFSPEKRSAVMSRIRSKDTKPELIVRRTLHRMGYRYRLHHPGLPGRPDIVLTRHRLIIQVKGCFWHGHRCLKGRTPKQNSGYWIPKIQGNIARDRRNERRLRGAGWHVCTVWECAIRTHQSRALGAVLRVLGTSRLIVRDATAAQGTERTQL